MQNPNPSQKLTAASIHPVTKILQSPRPQRSETKRPLQAQVSLERALKVSAFDVEVLSCARAGAIPPLWQSNDGFSVVFMG